MPEHRDPEDAHAYTPRQVRESWVMRRRRKIREEIERNRRGEFIRHAQEKRRDFTVDWVHLKLNDQAQRTVLCKDPFRAYDERVDRLIASM